MIDTTGFHNVEAPDYHADPVIEPSLSSTLARVLIEKSPLHAWTRHPRLGNVIEKPPTTNMNVGSAAHRVILEGSWDGIVVVEEESWRTQRAKDERDDAHSMGLIPLLDKDADVVRLMSDALPSDAIPHGMTEATIVWSEGKAWCRARLDRVYHKLESRSATIYDFKTTAVDATPEGWGRRLIWDYAMQHGLYRRGLAEVWKEAVDEVDWRFIVQETKPPYAWAEFDLDEVGYQYADIVADKAVALWKQCMTSNKWPSYPSGTNVMDAPYHIRTFLEHGSA